MKVLLVEDDEDKREQLRLFIITQLSQEITVTKSLQGAIRALFDDSFDLIVLDMSMTTFDVSPTDMGGRPQPFGGREVLLQMKRKNILTPVIVVTQYDRFGQGDDETSLLELNKQLKELFPNIYLGAIPYSIAVSGWQKLLMDLLVKNKMIK